MCTSSKPVGTILVLLAVCLFGQLAQAKYSGGTGEPNDPYLIITAEQMNTIGTEPNDWGRHFKLMADIDLSGFDGKDGRPSFNIIGDCYPVFCGDPGVFPPNPGLGGTPFTGVFDGNGHTISHLRVNVQSRFAGLFDGLGSGGQVRNLGVVDVNVTSSFSLPPDSEEDETWSYSCPAGGLVGYNDWGTLTNCYSTGAVRGIGSEAGGLVGFNMFGTVTQCYSMAAVTGDKEVGGLVGMNWYSNVTHCYSTGVVSGLSGGGLVGGSWGGETGCFWDIQTSGQTTSASGTGLTTAEMQTESTFRCWAGDGVWTIDEGRDYPRLWWENAPGEPITRDYYYGGGSGTQLDPYLIYTAEQLDMIGLIECDWNKQFRLMADIDLTEYSYDRAVVAHGACFTGVFNGNSHVISHLTITGRDYLGLFGRLLFGAEVRDLGVVDVNITGSGAYVGGLVGENYGGVVTQCYSSGSVSGRYYVGGLVGENYGSITTSYSTGAVTGTGWGVGGLVGYNIGVGGIVVNCYSTGAVSGSSVGGLAGGNSGDVTACFWNTQTSGRTWSAGGTGLTTAEMQTESTFKCWVGDGVWTIDEGRDYPRLSWEDAPGEPITGDYYYGGGSGTQLDPYLIYTAEQLDMIGLIECDWDKHFKLMADIDLTEYSYNQALVAHGALSHGACFTGVFNGNSHVISHLTITGRDYLGLFGQLASGAEVRDLGVVDVNITGSGMYVGGLVGRNDGGAVTRCYSTAVVSVTGWPGHAVGGLVGSNGGPVTQCYSTGAVSGGYDVGGLVGLNGGDVTHCYSTAAVSGTGNVGGLVGVNWCPVTQCYSTGAVSGAGGGLVGAGAHVVTASLWDMQTTGQTKSCGGTGKTTAQMQTAKTYLEAGWDFVGETANGTEDLWWINEGKGYPRLWWQAAPQ